MTARNKKNIAPQYFFVLLVIFSLARPGHSRHPSRQHYRAPSTNAHSTHGTSFSHSHGGHGRRISMPALGRSLDLEALAKEDRETKRFSLKDLHDLEFRTSQRSLFSAAGTASACSPGGGGDSTPDDKELATKLAQVSFSLARSNASVEARMHIESRHSRQGSRSRNSMGHILPHINVGKTPGDQPHAQAHAPTSTSGGHHSRSGSRTRNSIGQALPNVDKDAGGGALSELPPLEDDSENDRTQTSTSAMIISMNLPTKKAAEAAATTSSSSSSSASSTKSATAATRPLTPAPVLSRSELHKRHESTSTSSISSFSASRSSVSSSGTVWIGFFEMIWACTQSYVSRGIFRTNDGDGALASTALVFFLLLDVFGLVLPSFWFRFEISIFFIPRVTTF